MNERPKHYDTLVLAALPTAVGSARSFVVSRLEQWQAPAVVGDAVQLVEELVASAVETTGIPDPAANWSSADRLELLTVTLLCFRRSIGIEVRDSDPYPAPQLSELNTTSSPLQETLETVTLRWGVMAFGRGKVVWAELPVYERADSGLPIRRPNPTPYPRRPPEQRPDIDLLRRVRDGLEPL
ncbi:hypothetical protein [Amycolatopsis lurida]|uniref:Uncharacterized protein n=1 Tax=Amycolatopsis lurida NRRL 2430 TaxID=1460371 RepID=A0A2P2FVM6_AMYLU|nr:hypothetical protein [Amycolatopsis lurida]KFU80769.1 hypothetical protein BB31_12520 [Amycolatopsis lurida NRRL 2430]